MNFLFDKTGHTSVRLSKLAKSWLQPIAVHWFKNHRTIKVEEGGGRRGNQGKEKRQRERTLNFVHKFWERFQNHLWMAHARGKLPAAQPRLTELNRVVSSYPLQEGPRLGGESCHVNYLIKQTKHQLWGSNRIQFLPCIFCNVRDTSQINRYMVWGKEAKALQDIFSCPKHPQRHLVHAKRSSKFGPIHNVCEHIWSTPNGPW